MPRSAPASRCCASVASTSAAAFGVLRELVAELERERVVVGDLDDRLDGDGRRIGSAADRSPPRRQPRVDRAADRAGSNAAADDQRRAARHVVRLPAGERAGAVLVLPVVTRNASAHTCQSAMHANPSTRNCVCHAVTVASWIDSRCAYHVIFSFGVPVDGVGPFELEGGLRRGAGLGLVVAADRQHEASVDDRRHRIRREHDAQPVRERVIGHGARARAHWHGRQRRARRREAMADRAGGIGECLERCPHRLAGDWEQVQHARLASITCNRIQWNVRCKSSHAWARASCSSERPALTRSAMSAPRWNGSSVSCAASSASSADAWRRSSLSSV